MAENFYTILTNIGLAKIANSQVTGGKVDLIEMAVGDGNGAYYNPTGAMTELRNESWRGAIGSVEVDEDNLNWLVIEAVIPAGAGGFTVREVGIFDDAGDMIAIGKYPETYKPVLDEGSSKDLYIRMIIEVTNASSVTLKADPTVIIATRKYVDDKIAIAVGPIKGMIDAAEQSAKDYTDEEISKIPQPDLSGLATKQALQTVEQNLETTNQAVGEHFAKDGEDAHNISNITGLSAALENIMDRADAAFTSASNGKQVVGSAITGVDENVAIPADPTFQQLANAIGQISTGKKWANGTYDFQGWEADRSVTINLNLEFTPSLFFIKTIEIDGGNSAKFQNVFMSNLATLRTYHNGYYQWSHYDVLNLSRDTVRIQRSNNYNGSFIYGDWEWYAFE